MTGQQLVPVDRGTVIVPLDTQQVQAAMTHYQDGLKSILADNDYQEFKDRKTNETRRFPKRSAWRKIAYWFNLDLELIGEEIERDGRGEPVRARVKARAVHPNGRYADGDGGCSISERGFSKLEHDIPATAATRAMNRAISNLVGMGEVSAEEIDGGEVSADAFGPVATPREVDNLKRAIVVLMPGITDTRPLVERFEKDAGGYLPKVVARAMMLAAAHRPTPTDTAPGGEDGTGVGESATEDTPAAEEPAPVDPQPQEAAAPPS